jgi:hypothetical protein
MQKHKNVTCYKCGKKGHYASNISVPMRTTATRHQLDQVPAWDGVAIMMVSHYSK